MVIVRTGAVISAGLNWQIHNLFEPRTNNDYFFSKNTCIIIILVFLQALDLNIY